MNDLIIFEDAQFGQVRTIMSASNEPLFCLADVCRALEMKRFRVERLDKDVISNHPLQTAGGVQQVTFVNEDGLYDIVLDSRKPNAKKFRKWVTSEVLPNIRKTGSYSVGKPQQLSPAESLVQYFQLVTSHDRLLQTLDHDRNVTKDAINKIFGFLYEMKLQIESMQGRFDTKTDRYTVIGYCKAHDIDVTLNEASVIGGACSRACKRQNISVEPIKDPRFGKVNTYPAEIIAKAIEDRKKKEIAKLSV